MIPAPLSRRLGKDRGGVFYLHGEDEYGKDEAVRSLIEAHIDEATRDFNLDRLRGSEVQLETLASVLGTPPMMAEWRVVILREVQELAGSPRARELLLDTATDPPPGLALVLVCTPPPRSKARFYRDLEGAARSVEFAVPGADELPGWLMELARETFDRALEEDAARALAQAIGPNPPILARELEKLASAVDAEEPITRETVEATGTRLPRQDRWAWFDLVGGRRFEEALDGLHTLLAHGESGVGLTIGLGTHFLRLGATVAGGAGALDQVLAKNQRWLRSRFLEQARGWSRGEVEEALLELLRADRLLKASPMDEAHFMEEWLLGRIARATRAAPGAAA